MKITINRTSNRHFSLTESAALLLALAVWHPLPATAAGAASFAPPFSSSAGVEPNSVATGDFNGDGAPDVAVTNASVDTVSVLLNRNDNLGWFGPQTAFTAGDAPRSVATGDFNSDGATDLVVANMDGASVSVLLNLNNGSGGFGLQTTFAVGNSPRDVATGDFNGDGAMDLVVANQNDDSVSVLLNLNNGSGGFGLQTTFAAGDRPVSVAAGDFNGDGAPDLAAANAFGNSVSVLLNLNNGSGGFGLQSFVATAGDPYTVAVEDFNGDGAPDLVAINYDDDTVSVLLNLNNGSGGFGPQAIFHVVVDNPTSLATGDFNGDGAPDLAVTSGIYDTVSVLLNNGSGGFGLPTTFATAASPYGVVTGDFNGDGAPDLAVANIGADTVSVLLNLNQSFDADLLISQSVDKTSVKQGELLTYTITVSNFGPYAAVNTTVNDTLPGGTTFYSAQATKGTFTKPPVGQTGTVTWKMGTLQPDDVESAQIKVTVIVRGPTSITNTATVASASDDPNPANNSTALTVSVAKGSSGRKK